MKKGLDCLCILVYYLTHTSKKQGNQAGTKETENMERKLSTDLAYQTLSNVVKNLVRCDSKAQYVLVMSPLHTKLRMIRQNYFEGCMKRKEWK